LKVSGISIILITLHSKSKFLKLLNFNFKILKCFCGDDMKISLLAIGNELLENVIEKNSHFLSSYLMKEGFELNRVLIQRDNLNDIVTALEFISTDSDVIITSGGLGPTNDDLTREAVSKFLNKKLVIDKEALEELKQKFAIRNKEITKENEKQALKLEGSTILKNPVGTSPGIYIEQENREYILLPGVPSEFKTMIEIYFPDFIKKWQKKFPYEKNKYSFFYKTTGLSEAEVGKILDENLKGEFTYGTIADEGIITFRIDIFANDKKEASSIMSEILKNKLNSLIPFIFAENFSTSLSEVFVRKMESLDKTIVLAESCSGGLLAKKITDIPGSSRIFLGCIVCYSNELKKSLLGVPEDVLDKFGAVSSETAKFMDEGLKKLFPMADYRVSITGIAGPEGGSREKPVGTVFVAVGRENDVNIKKLNFLGTRESIREKTTNYVLYFLLKDLK
jgi:nicotinamide-nucleotide amidase